MSSFGASFIEIRIYIAVMNRNGQEKNVVASFNTEERTCHSDSSGGAIVVAKHC